MSTTPAVASRSLSQSRRAQSPPQRPTTPLRPLSRSSLRSSYTPSQGGFNPHANPLSSLEPAFAELSDSMADLEANFMHLQLMQESLARFSDCFASFLYGLNVNAWCVDFPEAPTAESFRRARENPALLQDNDNEIPSYNDRSNNYDHAADHDQTFLTTDSFVENPPVQNTRQAPTPRQSSAVNGRGGRGTIASSRAGRNVSTERGGRPSGLARASARGRRGGLSRG